MPTDDRAVLPPVKPPGLASIDDLLTPQQRAKMTADLIEMNRRRRRAETEAGWLPMA